MELCQRETECLNIFFLQIISPLQVSVNFPNNDVNNMPFSLGLEEGFDYEGIARGEGGRFLLMELLCILILLVFA